MTPRSPARHRHWGAAGAWLLVAVCGIAHATSLLPETPQARGFLNASSASVKWEATERVRGGGARRAARRGARTRIDSHV